MTTVSVAAAVVVVVTTAKQSKKSFADRERVRDEFVLFLIVLCVCVRLCVFRVQIYFSRRGRRRRCGCGRVNCPDSRMH